MVAKIGENMNIRRFAKISTDGHIVSYIHAGGKIGGFMETATAKPEPEPEPPDPPEESRCKVIPFERVG